MSFWRVTSASSAAQFYPGEGFRALNETDRITLYPNSRHEHQMLLDHTTRHLEWGNRIPTSLISTYDDFRTAKHEAQRRVQAGEEDVILWEMELDEDVEDDVEYADMHSLARKLRIWIDDNAYHNARHEVVFVDLIPRRCFLRRQKWTNGKGGKYLNMVTFDLSGG
ncbi:unnamed protein product [Penicillium camemberti]|uniref:Str. FM013 n=1 Tax=Penicillium camemberti (strain FM 013) TaxID=1429867 RepID=A0A0G4PQ37_PENC3|nr:unnamed protein product [Penicillium camemberti]